MPTDDQIIEAMARAIDPWAWSPTSLGVVWADHDQDAHHVSALIERNKRDGRNKAMGQARAAFGAYRKITSQ